MKSYFYRDKSGIEIGPLTLDALAKLRFGGVLNGDTPVRAADSDQWKPCRETIADPKEFPAAVATAESVPAKPEASHHGVKVVFAILMIAVVLCGGGALYNAIAAKTRVVYSFSLDGKELVNLQTPEVKVDGEHSWSGNGIKPGRHQISVRLEKAEPFERRFWVFYGTKNLGALPLESSKGSLAVIVRPSPASITVQQAGETVRQGESPLNVEGLPVGDYTLAIHRGEYEEDHPVKIQRQQCTETNIVLNLGTVVLSAEPTNAEFDLVGDGRSWHGRLPVQIDNVPGGTYQFLARRDGWELTSNIAVFRAAISTNKIEFPYGSIRVTSEPTGLAISAAGTELGKTPLTLRVKPGQYTLTAKDGENDLSTEIDVAPKQASRYVFAFHYGSVQLSSVPIGATVIRKGKEIGKTPVTLNHIPAGDTSLELRLQDYESTNVPIRAVEGTTSSVLVKLISEHYFQAMKQAREAFAAAQFAEANKFLAAALESEPNDATAEELKIEVSNAVLRAEEVKKEEDRLAAIARKEADRQECVAIIERAIQAAGGREAIRQFRSFKAVSRTSGKKKNTDFSLRATTYVRFPDTLRLDQEVENDPKKLGPLTITINQGRPARSVFCVSRSSSWEVVPGILGSGFMQGPISQSVQKELRIKLYIADCKTLLPLLGTDYSLEMISNSPSSPFNTVTITVQRPNHPVVTMHFDKDKGLLVGLDTESLDNSGHPVHDSERYSEYRSFSGFVLPTVTRYELDSGTSSTERMESFEPLGQYSANVFAEPRRQ